MILNFHVSFEVPDQDTRNWQSFIKKQLIKFEGNGFCVRSVTPIDDMDPKLAEAIEYEAWTSGRMEL
jgi:hypothetical protein